MSALSLYVGTRATGRLSVDVGKSEGVKTWLLEGGYYLDPSSTNDALILTTSDLRDYLSYVAFDYSRFSLASWESFRVARYERDAAGALGWPMIKLYYAAFFAAHALMRSDGGGVIRLEKQQAKKLGEFGSIIIGAQFDVQPGSFEVRTAQNVDGSLRISLTRLSESGGAHDAFWKRFTEYLKQIEADAVAANAANASQVVAEVEALSRLLKGPGGDNGTWLSVIRNKINYQHGYGLWFPSKGGHPALAAIDGARPLETANVRLDYNPSKETLPAFVAAAHYLSSINYDVAERVAARSTGATGFGAKWRRLRIALNGEVAPLAAA